MFKFIMNNLNCNIRYTFKTLVGTLLSFRLNSPHYDMIWVKQIL